MCKNQDFGRESTRGFEPAQRTWGQFNRRVERLTPVAAFKATQRPEQSIYGVI